MVIACDFDGTITKENLFPKIGEIRKNAIEVIKNLQHHGHKVFLWTCREGQYLEDAKKFLESKGLVMDGYNISPYDHINNGRKAIADLYIDDCNIQMKGTGFDWKRIESIILSEQKNNFAKIEMLRDNFRQHIGMYCRKEFCNKVHEVHFIFNKLSINKIGCLKSVNNSVVNGFTPEEHFEAAENIKGLFEHAYMVSHEPILNKNKKIEWHDLMICKITDGIYAFMNVLTWEKNEGIIDLYLSREAE